MISVDELVEYCKADDADYDRIQQLRDAAVALVNEPGGQFFGQTATVVDDVEVKGRSFLLSSTPQSALTVTYWNGSTWAEVDTTGFVISGRIVYGYGLNQYPGSAPLHLQVSYE